MSIKSHRELPTVTINKRYFPLNMKYDFIIFGLKTYFYKMIHRLENFTTKIYVKDKEILQ